MTKVIDMKHLQMITMMCVICVTASCTTQKIAYRERFEDAKGYALYACIAHMNKFVDSTSFINKDYSKGCIYNHRTTKTNQKYPSVNL